MYCAAGMFWRCAPAAPRSARSIGVALMHRPYRGYGLFEAGAPDQRGRPILRFLVQIVFVQREQLPAAHENPAIDDDRIGAAAVRAINQVCNRVVNRLPVGPPDVEQRDIGLLADVEPTGILVPV